MIDANMKMIVEKVDSVKEYLEYWTRAMADVHWFEKRGLFDYNRDEMVEEIAGEFGQSRSIHLVAKPPSTDEVLGVLGVKVRRDGLRREGPERCWHLRKMGASRSVET